MPVTRCGMRHCCRDRPSPGAAGMHTAGYLLMTGLVAWVVYEKLGLRRLTQLWFNVDFVWALALVGTGVFVLL